MKEVFRIAGAKPKGLTCNAFLRAIHRDYPELRGETAYFPEQGKFGFTALIGDFVFKALRLDNIPNEQQESGFPFRTAAFEREVKLLRHLKDKGLAVPEFIGEGHDPRYLVMARNRGSRLTQDDLDKMTVPQRRQIAKDFAGAMAGLAKAVSAQEAKDMGFNSGAGVESMDPEKFNALLDDPDVAKALGDNLDFCRRIQTEFAVAYEDYLKEPLTFSHGDFHHGNILYDPETRRIDGKIGCIIDLGLCHYMRPARELAALVNCYKPEFVSMVCDAYSKQTGHKISFRDLVIRNCATRVDRVKQCLGSTDPEKQKRFRELLDEMTYIKKYLAAPQQDALRKTSKAQRSPKR